jgi:formylglycine-generating enzyme required for sulfatase activity
MKIKLTLVILLTGCLLVPLLWSRAQSQRGQGASSTRPVVSGRYYALLIGVQNYRHPSVNPLDYPLKDAEMVRQALTAEYSFEPQDVTLLKDPDRETILTALDQLARKLRAEDNLLIFYAGHGYWDEQREQGYWLPSDAQYGSYSKLISNSDLRDAIRAIKARHTLLISDACFSGSLFNTRDAFTRSAAIEQVSRLSSRTAMTSGAMTTVPDRSVFVSYLLKRLRENQEPYLLAGDLFSQLRTPVINNSPRQANGSISTPRYGVIQEAGDEGGEFVFVRRSPTARPMPALTPVIALPSGVPPSALRSASFTTAKVDSNGRVTRLEAGPAQFYEVDLGGGVKMEMVAVPGGRFQMGSPTTESERREDETQHWVRVSDFWMGRFEVTQAQWKAVMGSLPPEMSRKGGEFSRQGGEFIGDDLPVAWVSWEEAKQYCERLDEKLRLPRGSHRLPYEAEWEYAARGGTQTPFAFGLTITPEVVNCGKYPRTKVLRAVAVGSLGIANPYGLFDLHGNAREWCEDWYGSYPSGEVSDPTGPSTGSGRVQRGGDWSGKEGAVGCRSADRHSLAPGRSNLYLGIRLVRK